MPLTMHHRTSSSHDFVSYGNNTANEPQHAMTAAAPSALSAGAPEEECHADLDDLQHLPSSVLRRKVLALQSELCALRSSTKSALEKSWDEVEHLSRQNIELAEKADRLERELSSSRASEARLTAKYEDMKERLLVESRASCPDLARDDDNDDDESDSEESWMGLPQARKSTSSGVPSSSQHQDQDQQSGGGGGKQFLNAIRRSSLVLLRSSHHRASSLVSDSDDEQDEECLDWHAPQQPPQQTAFARQKSAPDPALPQQQPQQNRRRLSWVRGPQMPPLSRAESASSYLSGSQQQQQEESMRSIDITVPESPSRKRGAQQQQQPPPNKTPGHGGAFNAQAAWSNLRNAVRDGGASSSDSHSSQRQLSDAADPAVVAELTREIASLRVKLSSRDGAIAEMERTASLQAETVSRMKMELDAAVGGKSGGGKSGGQDQGRQPDDDGEEKTRRELELEAETRALKRRVREKKKIVISQARKMEDAQGYIAELTSELRRLYDREDRQRELTKREEKDHGKRRKESEQ